MKEVFTFENIMAVIKVMGVLLGMLTIVKQSRDKIIAKSNQRKAEKERDGYRFIAKRTSEEFKFIGDTLLSIVQASKMTTEDKTNITKGYVKILEANEKNLEAVNNEEVDVAQDVLDVAEEIIGLTSGIINRTDVRQ